MSDERNQPGATSEARRGARTWHAVGVGAALAGAALSAGCVSVERMGPGAVALGGGAAAPAEAGGLSAGEMRLIGRWKQEDAWPRRWGSPAQSADRNRRATSLGVVEKLRTPLMAMRRGEEMQRKIEEEMYADIATLLAHRQFRTFSPTVTVVGEGRGSFVWVPVPRAEPPSDRSMLAPTYYLKFISGERASIGDTVLMQRTWMGFYEASPGTTARGVAVVLPGIFGTPGNTMEQVVMNLRSRGWAVLRMLSHPSRFTEQATFQFNQDADAERWAPAVASVLTGRAAECAYAVEGAMEVILADRPQLAGLPRVAVGFSGGAVVLPTVVARNPDAYAGAVIAAGGADFFKVASMSSYAGWIDALRLRFAPGLNRGAMLARLGAAYRDRAALDSGLTIDALKGKPMLFLHAAEDEAVPAELGIDLWNRAGRPERWVFDTGHEMLFLSLPWSMERLIEWIDANVPGGAAEDAAAKAVGSAPGAGSGAG
jgi:hypothetical protein